jgi:hypothetical protein
MGEKLHMETRIAERLYIIDSNDCNYMFICIPGVVCCAIVHGKYKFPFAVGGGCGKYKKGRGVRTIICLSPTET